MNLSRRLNKLSKVRTVSKDNKVSNNTVFDIMAKNNKNNAPAGFDFDDLVAQEPQKDSVQMGLESTEVKENEVPESSAPIRKVKKVASGQRATKGAAAGCKVGYTRHTYVLPETMVETVKNVAKNFDMSEVSAAEWIIQMGIDKIVAEKGKKAITRQKTLDRF